MNNWNWRKIGGLSTVVFLILAIFGTLFHWSINRIYVVEGKSLMLRYKGPLPFQFWSSKDTAKPGNFAEEGEIGILRNLRGHGRHFYCPFWWERTIVSDLIIKPGQVAIVTSKLGEDLDQGQFLVDGRMGETKHKGTLRIVYPPGRYRIHPYAYTAKVVGTVITESGKQQKHSGWVEIPTGYVGVVTNMTNNPLTGALTGIQNKVLPPGIYPVNVEEQQIDIFEIGYRETTIMCDKKMKNGVPEVDEQGEPLIADNRTGIEFPSNDGFAIHMDFTAIWGVMPDQAAEAVRIFGNVAEVENKVVIPQTESIGRIHGSRYSAVELLVGEDRQKFQIETAEAFDAIMKEKKLTMLYGLVRHVYIPSEVRVPIQTKYIADELKITAEQKRLTAIEESNFVEAEKKVLLEGIRVERDTDRLVEVLKAEGNKTAEETKAETIQLVAKVDREVAELEAQATVLKGQALATAVKLEEEAKSQKFELAVKAFGSPEAYNRFIFAKHLPDNIELKLLYAGEGTFWTDLKGFNNTAMGKLLKDSTDKSRK